MPTFMVATDIKAGKLIQLLPKYVFLEYSIYLVFPDRHHIPPKTLRVLTSWRSEWKENPLGMTFGY
jgi:DNA-binding transcriptional LysR family regulator